jgi:hypothetical protein
VFADGTEGLLCCGPTAAEVRDSYATALYGQYDAEEQAAIRSILLQVWRGEYYSGEWVEAGSLTLPAVEHKRAG